MQTVARPAASKINVLKNQDIPKPQVLFQHPPQNHEEGPWKPILISKPHAMVPLSQSLDIVTSVDDDGNEYQQ